MPGRRLSGTEKGLLRFWAEPSKDLKQPLLKAIAIEGPPPLRGIERLTIPFGYPITAISGRNGVGKSTILALATFSSDRPSDWAVAPWPTHPRRRQPKATSYAWTDFFFRGPDDPAYDGLTIRFAFTYSGNDIEIERRWSKGRWRTIPDPGRSKAIRFPRRPIEFLSLSRILPPAELQHVRAQFSRREKSVRYRLEEDMLRAMCSIFRQMYASIEVEERSGARLANCTGAAQYSGFDMGAGEHAVIAILSALQRLPIGGLLIVEEIEHGLHPEAQRYLVEALTNVVTKKKQQIIFSTHSYHVIDSLPREGRALLDRIGPEHRVISSPTTRFAMANMTGLANPEATLYVEDNFAAALVKACLTPELRRRLDIVPIGDARQVAGQLGAHNRGKQAGPAMCVFDGDCSEGQIKKWFRSEELTEDASNYTVLPGERAPEVWVLEELANEPFLSVFAIRIELSTGDTKREIERLIALPDHHDVPFELGQRLQRSVDVAVSDLIFPLASKHPGLDNVRKSASGLLN